MDNETRDNVVEMVREARNRHHEETKHMTVEEMWAYDQPKIDAIKALMKEVNPDDYDFSWLRRK